MNLIECRPSSNVALKEPLLHRGLGVKQSRRGSALATRISHWTAQDRTQKSYEPEVELLAAILATQSANSHFRRIAERLIDTYGSLARVMSAPQRDVARIPGTNESHAASIKAAFTTIVDTVYVKAKETKSHDYHWIVTYILWEIGQSSVEKVLLIYLDRRNRMIGSEILCQGSESFVAVSVREIILAVCNRDAASFIIAHNHPGGCVQPSKEDRALVTSLMKAAVAMDVVIIDSIIAAPTSWFSFRESGFL